jgi:hypothetical protein
VLEYIGGSGRDNVSARCALLLGHVRWRNISMKISHKLILALLLGAVMISGVGIFAAKVSRRALAKAMEGRYSMSCSHRAGELTRR